MSLALPPVVTLVRSVCIGGAVQDSRLFVEYIPSNLAHVVRESLDGITHVGSPPNDALISQPLNNAIVDAQLVGARLMDYVEPQNLLFVFSESAHALAYMPLELPTAYRAAEQLERPATDTNTQQRNDTNKPDANARAVVFCYVSDADYFQQVCRGEQEASQHKANCYQVAWSELEHIKRSFQNFSGHSQSVGGAA